MFNFGLLQFCVNMYLDNRNNPIEYQDHASKPKDFWVYFYWEIGRITMLLLAATG